MPDLFKLNKSKFGNLASGIRDKYDAETLRRTAFKAITISGKENIYWWITYENIIILILSIILIVFLILLILYIIKHFCLSSRNEANTKSALNLIDSDKLMKKLSIGNNSSVSLDSAKFLNFKTTKNDDNKYFHVSWLYLLMNKMLMNFNYSLILYSILCLIR